MTMTQSRLLRDDLRKVGLTGIAENIASWSRRCGNIRRDHDGDLNEAVAKLHAAEDRAVAFLTDLVPGYTLETR